MRRRAQDFPFAYAVLSDTLDKAGFMRPYELIDHILSAHKGRQNILARLGDEAEDGIDELLSQAMNYEQIETPTLTGFLNWFDAGDVQIKREMDTSGDQIRVMTVHGAKGLEAPVVILPDTARQNSGDRRQIETVGDGLACWKTDKSTAPEIQRLAQEARSLFDAQERMRLLYVALTRAENWLIVCGAGNRDTSGNDWYSRIQAGIDASAPDSDDVFRWLRRADCSKQVLANRYGWSSPSDF